MTHPQTNPQTSDHLDKALDRLKDHINAMPLTPPTQPPTRPAGPAAAPPRPVASTAPAPGQLWGPSSPRATSPLQLLVEVATDAFALKRQIEALVEEITGEVPAFRAREANKLPNALLPAMSQLSHEIERTHREIADLLVELRGRL